MKMIRTRTVEFCASQTHETMLPGEPARYRPTEASTSGFQRRVYQTMVGELVGVKLSQEREVCNCFLTATHAIDGRQDRTPISHACRTLCRDCRVGSASLRGRSARIVFKVAGLAFCACSLLYPRESEEDLPLAKGER